MVARRRMSFWTIYLRSRFMVGFLTKKNLKAKQEQGGLRGEEWVWLE